MEGLLDHFAQEHRVLRHGDDRLVAVPLAQLIDLGHLDGRLRGDLRHDLLKVKDRDQIVAALGDAGGNALVAAGNGLVRLLDGLPGDAADADHRVNTESDVHFIEAGDDEKVLRPLLSRLPKEVLGQVYHGDDRITGLENTLHGRMGMGHGLDRLGDQDLLDLCHIDAVKAVEDREFHDLDLIRAGFQQDPALIFLQHNSGSPFLHSKIKLSNNHLRPAVGADAGHSVGRVKQQRPGH